MTNAAATDHRLAALIARANRYFADKGYPPIDADEAACLEDPYRTDEAFAIVDAWSAQLDLPDELCGSLQQWIEENEGVSDETRSNGRRR